MIQRPPQVTAPLLNAPLPPRITRLRVLLTGHNRTGARLDSLRRPMDPPGSYHDDPLRVRSHQPSEPRRPRNTRTRTLCDHQQAPTLICFVADRGRDIPEQHGGHTCPLVLPARGCGSARESGMASASPNKNTRPNRCVRIATGGGWPTLLTVPASAASASSPPA